MLRRSGSNATWVMVGLVLLMWVGLQWAMTSGSDQGTLAKLQQTLERQERALDGLSKQIAELRREKAAAAAVASPAETEELPRPTRTRSSSLQTQRQRHRVITAGLCPNEDAAATAALHPPRRHIPGTSPSLPGASASEPHWARLPSGFWLNTHDPRDDHFISKSVQDGQRWDGYVHALFEGVLKNAQPGLVVDVGANIGYFTFLAASMGHSVVSFEPMNRNLIRLSSSVARNKLQDRIFLFHNAVSYNYVNVSMRATHETNQGNGQIQAGPARVASSAVYGDDYVSTVRLDDVLPPLLRSGGHKRVLLMKIDVEGHETQVLNGAVDLLCNHIVEYITIELNHEMKNDQTECPTRPFFEFISELGYSIHDVSPPPPNLGGTYEPALYINFPPNLVFVLRDTTRPPGQGLARGKAKEVCDRVAGKGFA